MSDDPHHTPQDPPEFHGGYDRPAVGETSYLTIRIALPQPLAAISTVLSVLAEEWPKAKTLPNQVDGWTIFVEANDGGS